jgi:hypothetical protein
MKKYCLLNLAMKCLLLMSIGVNLKAQDGAPDKIQFSFDILEGKRNDYRPGDILLIKINAWQTGRYCNRGIERTCIFTKGLRIKSQVPWVSEGAGKWHKLVKVAVLESRSNESIITAYRKTDKDEVVKKFYLKKK